MSERATPETDYEESIDNGDTKPLFEFARKLERERNEAREELADYKASAERARDTITQAFLRVAEERDQARELALELRDALQPTLTALVGRNVQLLFPGCRCHQRDWFALTDDQASIFLDRTRLASEIRRRVL